MKEGRIIRVLIVVHWALFSATTVMDKIVPDVYPLWVGADFYALFIKLFASLGLSDPILATSALSVVSVVEVMAFVCYLYALINLFRREDPRAEQWFYRGIALSVALFSLFSIGDQIFGDRFTLLEHTIFWIILMVSWVVFKYNAISDEGVSMPSLLPGMKRGFLLILTLTVVTSFSILDFSDETFPNRTEPIVGEEVVENVFKFDLPFLADKLTFEQTIQAFKAEHPDKKINYIYTGPDELHSKKRTHMLVYVFTEERE